MKRATQWLYRLLSSRKFGIALLVFFVLEAVWIACSGIYPLAFDEEFHWGIIRFYSDHWLPFVSSQPPGSGQYGPIIADPSYLFHYLMSFPYRVLDLFIKSDSAIIIILRFMNIAMFAMGLALFYKLIRRVGSSRLLANGALALFVLIPIAPLLAAHINYDNLIMILVPWSCWLVLDIYRDVQKRTVNVKTAATLVLLLMFSSLVKYAFLPVAAAIAAYVVYQVWKAFRGRGAQLKAATLKSLRTTSRNTKLVLVLLVVVGAGLFAQRYVGNIARYGHPLPDCGKVLGIKECMAYGPWERDYRFAKEFAKDDKRDFDGSPWRYIRHWFGGMHRRLLFMITGKTRGYVNWPPMPVIANATIVLSVAGVLALLFFWRRVFAGHPELYFMLLLVLVYCVVLWVYGYRDYLGTGRPVAINGRYLLVILFPFMALVGRALAIALRKWQAARTWVVAVAILLFLQGGGITAFILRSEDRWYWNNSTVIDVNNAARDVLKPLIIEGSRSPDN